MADQGWTDRPTWTSCFEVSQMWPAGPLGSELSTELYSQVKPYFQDEPFTFHIYFAYEEGQDGRERYDGP